MKNLLLSVALAAAFSTAVHGEPKTVKGPMAFAPIAGSAYAQTTTDAAILNSEPWVIPEGFTQRIISDESNLDIYPAMNDWTDMSVVNETGKKAGRYLYRTHEVRPQIGQTLYRWCALRHRLKERRNQAASATHGLPARPSGSRSI